MKKTALFVILGVGSLAATAVGVPPASALPSLIQGPSSSQTPYLVRLTPEVVTKSVLTTGDAVGGYRMAGIPDGLGAYDNGGETFTVLINHEIPNTAGVVRAHGGRGAFVSKWTVDKKTLKVRQGETSSSASTAGTGPTRSGSRFPADPRC